MEDRSSFPLVLKCMHLNEPDVTSLHVGHVSYDGPIVDSRQHNSG
jgi:hypothetical protein